MFAAMFKAAPRNPRLRSRRPRRLAAFLGGRRRADAAEITITVPNAATVGLADQSTEDELVMIAGAHGVTVGPLPSATL
jgi:type IV pilus biogenesis protein CpaD/CtpE